VVVSGAFFNHFIISMWELSTESATQKNCEPRSK